MGPSLCMGATWDRPPVFPGALVPAEQLQKFTENVRKREIALLDAYNNSMGH